MSDGWPVSDSYSEPSAIMGGGKKASLPERTDRLPRFVCAACRELVGWAGGVVITNQHRGRMSNHLQERAGEGSSVALRWSSRWAMTDERFLSFATGVAVLVVAAIAAVVSFVHIEHLAISHGQSQLAGVLLPLSIDGTVAAASLVMLRAALGGLPTPALAQFMLGLSVMATLLANVGYGLPFGMTGALISGWPAIAFVGSVEMVIGMIRRTRPEEEAEMGAVAAAEARATDAERRASEAEAAKRHAEVEVAEAVSWAEETLRRASEANDEAAESPSPTGEAAAREALITSVREGKPLSVRTISQRFALTRYAAAELRRDVISAEEADVSQN